jgi:hypothetical protein
MFLSHGNQPSKEIHKEAETQTSKQKPSTVMIVFRDNHIGFTLVDLFTSVKVFDEPDSHQRPIDRR